MINKISVENLYGEFNHTIDLKDGNITIIIGENGLGKTVILKMVKYLFENNIFELCSYEFSKFSVHFQNEYCLDIIKKQNENEKDFRFNYNLTLIYRKGKKKIEEKTIESSDLLDSYRNKHRNSQYKRQYNLRFNHIIRDFLPKNIEYFGGDRWVDIDGMIYDSYELVERYHNHFPKGFLDEMRTNYIPDWFVNLTRSLNVRLVETQRLLTKLNSEEKEFKSSVSQYSNELKELIKNKAVEATNLSTKLDRTYTNRLIQKITSDNSFNNIPIDQELNDLENKRLFLIKVGLLEQNDEAILPINLNLESHDNETLRDVLGIYIEDSNEKLVVYSELSKKINTLLDIINKRFAFKEFSVNKNEGFVFVSSKTEKKIPLANLSSGEQHELVLLYELLFNTPENSLILIDEPEISLHINWQNEFINDLREVSQLINLKSIIATHSPDIINNNWDLTVEL